MSRYFESVKRFFFKESFDFYRKDISLYKFHPQLCILLAINGIFFNKRSSLYRFVWPFFNVGFGISGLVLEYIFISHYLIIKDYSLATECFCYAVIIGCIPIVSISTAFNTNNLHMIVERMNEDFNIICKRENRNRRVFLNGQLLIWQLCNVWFCFIAVVSGLYSLAPAFTLTYQSLFIKQDEYTKRPLQFPMWLPHDDPYRTPNYEIFLVFQACCVISFVQTFCVYVYILFHILLHYYTIMDVIILEFEVLFDGLEEKVAILPQNDTRRMEIQRKLIKRVGNIVKMHISVFEAVNTVSSVYGFPLMYQVMFSSIAICLIAFQIAEKLKCGTIDIMFILLGLTAVLQIWIPCYLGTLIMKKVGSYALNEWSDYMDKLYIIISTLFLFHCLARASFRCRSYGLAFTIGDACWNSGWHQTSLGRLVRSDIIIIILRAQKPVTIKFVGLPNVQLETFSLLISKAYSYLNMLRQYS